MVAGGGEGPAVGQHHIQVDDVVHGAAITQRPRPAGVVTDHSAHRAPRVGRGVRPETQPVRCRSSLQVIQDHPGLHHRGRSIRIEGHHPIEVPGKVEDNPAADGVAGNRGARATRDQRHPQLTADPQRRRNLLTMSRKDHRSRNNPIVGRVRGVLGAPPTGGIHLHDTRPAQCRHHLFSSGGTARGGRRYAGSHRNLVVFRRHRQRS